MSAFDDFKKHANQTIRFFEGQLSCIYDSNLTGGLVETIKVSSGPVGRIAMVVDDNHRIMISPYDRSYTPKLAKELQEQGFSAYAFSKEQVVINVPPRCGQQKEEVCAYVRKLSEAAKVAVRNARKKCKQKLGKDFSDKELQKITDEAIATIDKMVDRKCKYLRQ